VFILFLVTIYTTYFLLVHPETEHWILKMSFYVLAGVNSITFLYSWLLNPGYLEKKNDM
jgi:hypothetical protein